MTAMAATSSLASAFAGTSDFAFAGHGQLLKHRLNRKGEIACVNPRAANAKAQPEDAQFQSEPPFNLSSSKAASLAALEQLKTSSADSMHRFSFFHNPIFHASK